MVFAALGMVVGLGILVARICLGEGWANQGTLTVLGLLIFLTGAQFFAFGLIGEYIGRIFQQVRLREPWFVSSVERVGEDIERPLGTERIERQR
jgi:undecaprenyl-phosphate 4-deoxy-4-formamido-L-arabinose transferase